MGNLKTVFILDNMCSFILSDNYFNKIMDKEIVENKYLLFCEQLPNLEIHNNVFRNFV